LASLNHLTVPTAMLRSPAARRGKIFRCRVKWCQGTCHGDCSGRAPQRASSRAVVAAGTGL